MSTVATAGIVGMVFLFTGIGIGIAITAAIDKPETTQIP